jgi:hypothetical protein
MHPLDGSKFKIERAGEHLERLDQLVRTYLRDNTQLISAEFNMQNLVNIYRYKPPADIPIEINLLAGDVINNLRSSLEYLAWQLVIINKGSPSDNTGFPIFKVPNAKVFKRMTAGMPPEACEIIERLQPYRRGEGAQDDPLWRLHALWSIEKHRHLTIVALSMLTSMGKYLSDERPEQLSDFNVSRLDNGDIVLEVPIPNRTEEYFEPEFLLNVVLSDEGPGQGNRLPDSLWSIYYLLRDRIIPRFMHFFE